MRNPWRMQDGPDNKINRNNFPMSFQYNGTFKYGKIYPIGLIRTIPGASYQIDSTLALNFMPTSFPIQTRQRAYVHFFYGRDRNFWKDYKDFVNGMNPDLVKPYLDESVTKARTGNLLDYLGVPTTIVGKYGNEVLTNRYPNSSNRSLSFVEFSSSQVTTFSVPKDRVANFNVPDISYIDSSFFIGKDFSQRSESINYPETSFEKSCCIVQSFGDVNLTSSSTFVASCELLSNANNVAPNNASFELVVGVDAGEPDSSLPSPISKNTFFNSTFLAIVDSSGIITHCVQCKSCTNGDFKFPSFGANVSGELIIIAPCCLSATSVDNDGIIYRNYPFVDDFSGLFYNYQGTFNAIQVEVYEAASEVRDIDDSTSPYWRSSPSGDLRKRIKLNAIPCRMYETIYNLYYRNPQNNPYILNGKPEYNVFIPSKDGGLDSNLYELRYRNWEDDFLTTAVQTPQQGIAPLVGLTDRGATVTLTNEDGSVTRYVTNLDENGNVTGIETTDSSEPLLTQALIDAVSYGISIEDLRNVNAMQKWLELNLRKGYQYKDIIEARWGISISYNELDLPEFIGGFTQEVGLQAVTQTTSHGEGIEGALGWQAGRMYASGSGRSITHYCEEEGYIMALLTVVPIPNYSQLLPKHWFTRDLLDSYQPEFNHIGFQPITYKEVCPVQAYQESTENVDALEQTFGYQRPWYEYFNQVDEVHGQFRTTFKDFLINRTFDVKPELSESFLLVDPDQVNDVFAVTTDDDKIIGAINHEITAKLPISLYAQARLE